MYKNMVKDICNIITLFVLLMVQNTNAEIQERVLDNGLKIIVETDKRSPAVVQQTFYRVGSVYEDKGKTGLSHLLEHMMFKGTAHHPAGEYSKIVAQIGGRENAFTSKEYTAYYQIVASDKLELVMEMEADRMRNLRLSNHEFKKEVLVVKEERRSRVDDRPKARLFEQFLATAYPQSSEGFPITGWPRDLDNLSLIDLRKWYDRWYRPNNAIVVVVGNVVPDYVFQLAKKYFGVYKSVELKRGEKMTMIPQNGFRRTAYTAPVKLPFLVLGFKVPSHTTVKTLEDVFALEVLAAVLDGGNSARFSKNLIRGKMLATDTGVSYNLYNPRNTLFYISATPSVNVTLDQLEKAIFDEIKLIKTNGIEISELKRVKAQVVAADVFSRDSLRRRALAIGRMEAKGFGYKDLELYLNGIESVTTEAVKRVAQLYLKTDQLTIGVLRPSDLGD